MADFEGNVGQDLAADMKKEAIDEVILEFKKKKAKLPVNLRKETVIDEKGEEIEEDGFSVYFPFKREDGTVENIKIATIDAKGTFNVNWNILNDEKFSKTERENLEKLLNGLGLDQDKVDINKMQEQLKELEEKQKEKDKNKDDKEKEDEETNKDDNEGKEEEEEEKDDEEKKAKDDKNVEEIAKKKKIPEKDILVLDEKTYERHPELRKEEPNLYLYRGKDGKVRAEYIDGNGKTRPSKYFNESATKLREEEVTVDGKGKVTKQNPYQLMTTKGLKEKNKDARELYISVYIKNGSLEAFETVEGRDGERVGYQISAKRRDELSHEVKSISEPNSNVKPKDVSKNYKKAEETSKVQNGAQLTDLSREATIQRFIEEGYNQKEAIAIYGLMEEPRKLQEEDAKEVINQEIIKEQEKNRDEDSAKVPGENPLSKRPY